MILEHPVKRRVLFVLEELIYLNNVNSAFAAFGALVGAFLGGWDGLIYALVVFVAIDYATGLLAAWKRKKVSSDKCFWGGVRKLLMFALVGVAHILDTYILGTGSVLRTALIFFFLSNEGLSLLENTAILGVPYSQKLKDVLTQLKDKGVDK